MYVLILSMADRLDFDLRDTKWLIHIRLPLYPFHLYKYVQHAKKITRGMCSELRRFTTKLFLYKREYDRLKRRTTNSNGNGKMM